MKRLQFRHNNEAFQNRTDALKYFADIVDTTKTASTIFQSSLYAEPLVAKYLDEDGNQQVILAIGVDSGLTPYHIIDSKEIAERLDTNKEAIESEVKRAKDAEMALSGSIETEIARAIEAERVLSGAVDTERDERIAADAVLQTQITENVAKIVPITENLGANVREEYALKNAKGEELGSHIKVYKDSALVGAEINYKGATAVSQKEDGTFEFTYGADMDKETEYLYLIYRNENGGLSLVALDFENFLMESEEGFGIKIVEHKIAINIKDNEKYLKVSENGLQTINIDEAIKDATDKLNAKLDEEINRSKAADDYISGVTNEFSAATVAEFISVNSALTVETERALAAELHLSGAINTERDERIKKDEDILAEIGATKEFNTDLDKKIDVEITRSTKEDANFKTQIEHLALDLTNEISNREGANTSIRAEFAAGDAALGSRINTEAEIRSAADNALSERIDNEAKIRGTEDTSLASAISGVSERLKAVEADYLVYQDKADVLLAVSGAHNTAIEAVNAAASAQTTANEAKAKIEGFMAAAEIGGAAVDTLIEIQNYIKSDNTAASEIVAAIAENKSNIAAESERAKGAEKTLDDNIKAETSARVESANILSGALATEITRATGAESVNAASIANEVTRATNVESSLQTALTTEISNRELADNAIRSDFATADTALGNRIAAEELARQTAYNALNTRIDNEAKIRGTEDTSLASAISGVSERLKAVEADYLVYQDKADVLLAVSGAHNTAIEAVNAAASAQTTANEAKAKIEGFMAAAEIGGAAVDTLIEIQNYIKSDNTAASEIVAAIAENKSNIAAESERAKGAEKTLDDNIKAETSARVESTNILSGALATEITRAMGVESVNASSIANEVTRATNVESSLQTALTTEISNRELADNAIRSDFATADTALGNRIAAEELARQTTYDALNTRIDNEATTRTNVVATLTTEITNGDKAVRASYEAADAILQGAIQAETKNREAADSALSDAISKEVTTRSTEIQRVDASIASLLSSISGEIQDRKNEDAIINGNLVALSGNVLTEINTAKTEAISESFGKSSAYTDAEIAKAIQDINNKKVNNVSYDNGNKKIYLTFADGTVSKGFDASEFVVDGMLNEVKFNENTNEITFKWNTTAGITDVIVPLNKFVDQYRVSTASASYLKISENNEISAIVDNGDGFSNTLATTTFVTTSVNGAYNKINLVSSSVETINNSVKELSGSIKSSIDKIAILNADKKTEGSVLYKIDNEFEKSLITDGVPVTAVSPEEANKVHSLIRQITVNGEMRYYAMSDATEMFYVKPRATETAPIEAVNLNDYITGLETRVAVLEEKLSRFESNMEQTVKGIIKSYLDGTENEIKITETDNKLKIGFDDNAIFGEI